MNLLSLRICWNCSSSRFTSCTGRPAPCATRSFRDPLNTRGSARSSGVIESTIASTCFRRLSSIDTPCSALALTPGRRPSTCFSGPIDCICFSATRKSCRSMPFLDRTFCSRRLAASASTFAAAFSTSATTSPCPKIRPAMRTGSNGSSASVFSPTPTYLIGTPITPWIDAAARITVELRQDDAGQPDRVVKATRDLYGVLSRHAIGDEEHFARRDGRLQRLQLVHHRRVDLQPSGGIDDHRACAYGLRFAQRVLHQLHDVSRVAFAENRDANLRAELLELFRRGRPIHIRRDQPWRLLLELQPARELRRGGRFPRSL